MRRNYSILTTCTDQDAGSRIDFEETIEFVYYEVELENLNKAFRTTKKTCTGILLYKRIDGPA